MKKKTIIAGLLATSLLATPFLLTAQDESSAESAKTEAAQESAAKSAGKDYVVLSVGGETIKKSEVQKTLSDIFPGQEVPDIDSEKVNKETRDNILRNIATERLLLKEAQKAGVDKSESIERQLESLRKQLVIREYLQQKGKELVKDEDLKKQYDEFVAKQKPQDEVKARHILVSTEEEAKKIHEQLKGGADFNKIAEEKSKDPGSKASGGDLGYFTEDRMVPEFSKTAFALKKGEISEPVKSPFGWHIIKVEDRRAVKPPSFDDMKDQLRGVESAKAVQNYINGLLSDNKAVYYNEKGEPQPVKIYEDKAPAAGLPAGVAPQ
jgi:peptidyl-prolyl cis-trans isomerase C